MKTTPLRLLLILLINAVFPSSAVSAPFNPFDEISHHPQYRTQLQSLLEKAVAHNFGRGGALPESHYPFDRPTGLFVTATREGRVLGCMGTLSPQYGTLTEEIFFNLQKAFSQDPRHRPITANQLEGLVIVLTAVGKPVPLGSLASVNPARDAILIKSGSREAVVLAGEARTLRYLLALAKSKAGIGKDETFQIFRLPARTLRIPLGP